MVSTDAELFRGHAFEDATARTDCLCMGVARCSLPSVGPFESVAVFYFVRRLLTPKLVALKGRLVSPIKAIGKLVETIHAKRGHLGWPRNGRTRRPDDLRSSDVAKPLGWDDVTVIEYHLKDHTINAEGDYPHISFRLTE